MKQFMLIAGTMFCGATVIFSETVGTPPQPTTVIVNTPVVVPSAPPEVKGIVVSIDRFTNTFQVKNASGQTVTLTATTNLLIHVNGALVTFSNLNQGDMVTVHDTTPLGSGQIP